ncbi:conserved hypothetical protein [Candidatus Sulfopaludibacter sp. SbA3]|nr:conserved hypothetical protein [Candidatus Sulfopaludibacter sp. SbA3]
MIVPVNLVLDGQVKWRPRQLDEFQRGIWAAAVRDFAGCGVQIEGTWKAGGVQRPPGREPVISGLERGVLNVVITNRIPLEWDQGRAWSGVTTRYRGYDLCMVALDHAHGHQAPLLSLNTCTHELLHALMLDILEDRPPGLAGQARELRIDWYATRLWLFHDGAAIRKPAQKYVERLGNRGGLDLK